VSSSNHALFLHLLQPLDTATATDSQVMSPFWWSFQAISSSEFTGLHLYCEEVWLRSYGCNLHYDYEAVLMCNHPLTNWLAHHCVGCVTHVSRASECGFQFKEATTEKQLHPHCTSVHTSGYTFSLSLLFLILSRLVTCVLRVTCAYVWLGHDWCLTGKWLDRGEQVMVRVYIAMLLAWVWCSIWSGTCTCNQNH